MKTDLSDIIVILDRSGSMGSVRDATIAAYNGFLADQKSQPGEARVSLYQFDDQFEVNYVARPINAAPELSRDTFVPRGFTALLGAMGRVIDETGERLAALPEVERPAKVIVVVLTDGAENSSGSCEWSKKYDRQAVLSRVTHQTEKYAWQFVYLGANQDAIATATQLGVMGSSCLSFDANPGSVTRATKKMSDGLSSYRAAPSDMTPSEYVVNTNGCGFFGGSAHADDDVGPADPLLTTKLPVDFKGYPPGCSGTMPSIHYSAAAPAVELLECKWNNPKYETDPEMYAGVHSSQR